EAQSFARHRAQLSFRSDRQARRRQSHRGVPARAAERLAVTRAMRAAFAVASLLFPIFVAASAPDVYVWQRQWTPAVRAALDESRDGFGGVRVLVAQSDRRGHWHATSADPRAFANDARRRVAVVRYDGAGVAPDPDAFIAFANALATRWR